MQASPDCLTWDKPQFLKRVRFKRERAVKLLGAFCSQVPSELDDLISEAKANNYTACASLAHMIKGVSANLSANQLTSYMLQVETVCDEKDADTLAALVAQLPGQLQALNTEITSYLESD